LVLFKASEVWRSSQMANTPPTVSARQLWDLLKNLVDRVTLRRRAKSDSSNQQTVDNRQPFRVDLGRLTFLSRSLGHCATSPQEDRCRELASRDKVKFTSREAFSRSIQSEVGSCCQRGTHVCGTDLLLSTRKRLKAETLFDEVNILGLLVIAPYLTKEHLHRKRYRRKFTING
jgi:hypothetical protein